MKNSAPSTWADELWLDRKNIDELMVQIGWLPSPKLPNAMMVKRAVTYITQAARSAKKERRYTRFARAMRFQFPRRKQNGALSAGSIQRFLASEHYQGQVYKNYLTFDYTATAYYLDLKQLKAFMDAIYELHAEANS